LDSIVSIYEEQIVITFVGTHKQHRASKTTEEGMVRSVLHICKASS
jgi:hypothetical protein